MSFYINPTIKGNNFYQFFFVKQRRIDKNYQFVPAILSPLRSLITYVHRTVFLTFVITKTSLDQFGR